MAPESVVPESTRHEAAGVVPGRAAARSDVGRRGSPRRAVASARPAGSLGDADLADEIELYGAVVVAASEKDGLLTTAEIDDALGVDDGGTRDDAVPDGGTSDRAVPDDGAPPPLP